jgi:hypothetical protein
MSVRAVGLTGGLLVSFAGARRVSPTEDCSAGSLIHSISRDRDRLRAVFSLAQCSATAKNKKTASKAVVPKMRGANSLIVMGQLGHCIIASTLPSLSDSRHDERKCQAATNSSPTII